MNIFFTLSTVAVFFASIIKSEPQNVGPISSLVITSPIAGTVLALGSPVSVTVENGIGATVLIQTASVTFASPCGSFIQVVPVGSTQILNLPCNVVGQVTIAARSGATSADNVQVFISPAFSGNPCPNPCSSRSRLGCGYYAQEVKEITEFNTQHKLEESH